MFLQTRRASRRNPVPVVEHPSPHRHSKTHPSSSAKAFTTLSRPSKRPRLDEDSATLPRAEAEVESMPPANSADSTAPEPTPITALNETICAVQDRHALNEESQLAMPTAIVQTEAVVSHPTPANATTSTGEQADDAQNTQSNRQTGMFEVYMCPIPC